MIVVFSARLGTISVMAEENIRVVLDGQELTFDADPQIIDNRTMVPMRAIFEALGAEVEWDSDTQTITATQDDIIIIMQIENVVITVGVDDITLDVPPLLVDGRTFVPVRAVAGSLNADIEWDAGTRTVIITRKEQVGAGTAGGRSEALDILLGRDDIVYDIRYFFEQQRLPEIVFGYHEEFIGLILDGDVEAIEDVIRTEWYFISAGAIADYLMASDGSYSHENIPVLMESVTRKRVEFGLGDEHIVSVALEQINTSTSAIIIEMYYTRLPLLSSFITIVYNEEDGLNYFTLERSIDFMGTGDVPYMFCFITPTGRGTLFTIANNRAEFINAIRAAMN